MTEETKIERVKTDREISFEIAQREAKALSMSSLIPEVYQNNIPNTLIAMELANRIGAGTLSVMQHLYIVHGKPAFDATFLISTVNASGRFSPIRYKMEGEQNTDTWGCRAYAVDKESGEECVGPLVTIEMARAEGWVEKKGSKWKTMPELMLHYRAATFWTRLYCPDLSMGIRTRDELDDIQVSQADVVGRPSIESLTEILEQKYYDDRRKADALEDESGNCYTLDYDEK